MRISWIAIVLAGCGGASAPHDLASAIDAASIANHDLAANDDPTQLCVDTINMYRATLGLTAYARWNAEETCADGQSQSDSMTGTAHGAFGTCGESAQDECPGWPGPESSAITGCLAQMWAEGPGTDFSTHGHYINMSSTSYTKVACGFYTLADGSVWAAQDFQ